MRARHQTEGDPIRKVTQGRVRDRNESTHVVRPLNDRSADSDFLRPGSPGRGSGVSMATISARVRHYHVEHAVITPTNHPMLRVHGK